MLATTLTFSALFSIGALILGFMLGWFANTYYDDYIERISTPQLHPEMYDEEGNLLHSRLLSVRFEPESIFDYDEDD
jgi:hypothetical protein